MYHQKFSISRALALSLSVALLTAAPLLCIHPISAQLKRAQRVAMKQHREVPGSRTSSSRLATSLRRASAPGALARTPQRGTKEEVRDGENRFKAPGLVEVTRAAGLPVPEPTWTETEIPGMRVTPVVPERAQ
jgi:hypothetical protein